MTAGRISVLLIAGDIQPTSTPLHPSIGQQVRMGDSGLTFNITPEVARQWLPVIQQIAEEK